MRLDLYILEECNKAWREGYEEGYKQGFEEGCSLVAKLAQALTDAGRADEIAEALADEQRFDALMKEFGLAPADD